MNFTAEKYINAILGRYIIGDKDLEKLQAGADLLNKTFGDYYWSDVENALAWYYTNKNDKTRPTIAQMKDALAACGVEKKTTEQKPIVFNTPTTSIWSIRETFDKLVQVLTDGGVLPDMDGKFSIKRSLVDPKTNNVVICPRQWLGWQIQDAMKARPDLFAKFNNLSWLEQLTIAVQNKLVVFKVRDWAKLAQEMPADARNGNGWNNYTKNLQKAM